jgi:hypothetical protein
MRSLTAGLLAVLLLAGCGSRADDGPAGGERDGTSPMAAPSVAGDGAPSPVALDAVCTGPEGIRVAHPADWEVNPGTVVPACTRFAPHPFTVRAASDVRAAAVVLSVEAAAYGDLAAREPGERSRAPVEVDGRPGIRVEITTPPGLLPTGTSVTRWVLDLGSRADGPRTLVADTVHPPGTDPAEAAAEVAVLDAMVSALDLDRAGDPAV